MKTTVVQSSVIHQNFGLMKYNNHNTVHMYSKYLKLSKVPNKSNSIWFSLVNKLAVSALAYLT